MLIAKLGTRLEDLVLFLSQIDQRTLYMSSISMRKIKETLADSSSQPLKVPSPYNFAVSGQVHKR